MVACGELHGDGAQIVLPRLRAGSDLPARPSPGPVNVSGSAPDGLDLFTPVEGDFYASGVLREASPERLMRLPSRRHVGLGGSGQAVPARLAELAGARHPLAIVRPERRGRGIACRWGMALVVRAAWPG